MDSKDQAKGKEGTPKTATAKNVSVGVDLALLAAENSELKAANDILNTENESLKIQLGEANMVIERDLREDLYRRIVGKSNYTRAELEPRNVEELQKLDADLTRGLGAASNAKSGTFKPVSSAKDSVIHGTVPDLFGKDRATILKELGEA
jgi:hypothetical protein